MQSALPFNPSLTWLISNQTTDEELAVILEIFDYVSFNQEAYVMVNYGFEGEHFGWEGAPLVSRIVQPNDDLMRAYNSGALVFAIRMLSPAGNLMRDGDNVLTRYAASEAGRRAVILPYREDIHGEFTQQYTELTERYGEELMCIRKSFSCLPLGVKSI